MQQTNIEWDEAVDAARIKHRNAARDEDNARSVLTETKLKVDRTERLRDRARKLAEEARIKEGDARRLTDESRRKSDDARRRGLARHRWETDMRRWTAEGQRSAQEMRRWEDDGRRKDREARALAQEIRGHTEEVARLAKETQHWDQRLKYLNQIGAGLSATHAAVQDESQSLKITEQATEALMNMLEGMSREPEQLLRLSATDDGQISLLLDFPEEGDTVIEHQGTPVLLIESPLPVGLVGSTLDVGQTAQGEGIVITVAQEGEDAEEGDGGEVDEEYENPTLAG